MMTEVFWSFFITSVIGFLVIIGKICYKSKCKEIDVCCIKIVRDVVAEEKIDEIALGQIKTTKSADNVDETKE